MLNSLHKVLSSIKNGQKNNLLVVNCKKTKIAIEVLNVLQENGLILGYRYKKEEKTQETKIIEILLKYNKEKPVIKSCELISKPSKKVYKTIEQLQDMQEMQRMQRKQLVPTKETNWKSVINGMYILTTTKGIISDKTALKYNISGKIICKIN